MNSYEEIETPYDPKMSNLFDLSANWIVRYNRLSGILSEKHPIENEISKFVYYWIANETVFSCLDKKELNGKSTMISCLGNNEDISKFIIDRSKPLMGKLIDQMDIVLDRPIMPFSGYSLKITDVEFYQSLDKHPEKFNKWFEYVLTNVDDCETKKSYKKMIKKSLETYLSFRKLIANYRKNGNCVSMTKDEVIYLATFVNIIRNNLFHSNKAQLFLGENDTNHRDYKLLKSASWILENIFYNNAIQYNQWEE